VGVAAWCGAEKGISKNMTLLVGDSLEMLQGLPDRSVQCCVTSPPYWGLRDYGHEGQIGLEPTPEAYVAKMVEVFREVRRVLREDGTLWLNLGDSYARQAGDDSKKDPTSQATGFANVIAAGCAKKGNNIPPPGLKHKDLIGIPWRVAFALQADGWWLRQDIIWAKPNPMPESVTDRCTKAHEYVFLLTKSERYFYDADAVSEAVAASSVERLSQTTLAIQGGSDRVPGKTNGPMKAVGGTSTRNRRSVWTITTKPYSEAHFATFPPELPRLCILAGSKLGDVILDPFGGSGTTAMVAIELGRTPVIIELNPEYAKLIRQRTSIVQVRLL